MFIMTSGGINSSSEAAGRCSCGCAPEADGMTIFQMALDNGVSCTCSCPAYNVSSPGDSASRAAQR
jgi:hypothetical protein